MNCNYEEIIFHLKFRLHPFFHLVHPLPSFNEPAPGAPGAPAVQSRYSSSSLSIILFVLFLLLALFPHQLPLFDSSSSFSISSASIIPFWFELYRKLLNSFWNSYQNYSELKGRPRPNIGFGYCFGAESANFLGFGLTSVTAVTDIWVSAWLRLRP